MHGYFSLKRTCTSIRIQGGVEMSYIEVFWYHKKRARKEHTKAKENEWFSGINKVVEMKLLG